MKNKKSVLFIRSNPVSPDSRVEKEAYSLTKAGYKVDILGWDRDEDYSIKEETKQINDEMLRVYKVGIKSVYGGGMKKNFIPLLKFQFTIRSFMKNHKEAYDIIHACDFDTAFTAYRICKHTKQWLVYDIFDYYVDAFSVPGVLKRFIRNLDTKVMRSAKAVIICTEKRREQLEWIPQNLCVIHNSPPEYVKTECEVPYTEKMRICYVGILNDGRMLPELLEIVEEENEFELCIGGFGKFEELVQLYADKCDRIHYYGKIPYEKTLELESGADVLTAIYDPRIRNHIFAAPNKFYESLMLAKPVIMIEGTGMSDVVSANDIGILCEYSKNSLKQGLRRLYARRQDWDKMGARARKLYESEFSWNVMSGRLVELYDSLGEIQ